MTLTISHTAADGTLIDGTSRGDGSGDVLAAHGWRWFRSIGFWGIRSSRDRAPKVRLIELTAEALRASGFDVEIDIDSTARPTAEVEADRIDRQAARVEALELKAGRRSEQAESAWEAEQRADHRELDGHERTLFVVRGVKQIEKFPPDEGTYRQSLITRIAERAEQITYWEEIRAQQIASGQANNFGPDTIAKGDLVRCSGVWYPVVRVNKKSVTVPARIGGDWTDTIPYHKLAGHRQAKEAETASASSSSIKEVRS